MVSETAYTIVFMSKQAVFNGCDTALKVNGVKAVLTRLKGVETMDYTYELCAPSRKQGLERCDVVTCGMCAVSQTSEALIDEPVLD